MKIVNLETIISDNETREREDRTESDTSPVTVSSFNVDDRTGQTVVSRESNHEPIHQANQKFPKTNKKETMIERGTRCMPTQVTQVLKSRSGCKNSRKFWWMMKFQHTETLTPVLLMKYLQSSHPRDVWIWVNTVFILTSLKTEIARSVRGPKITRAPCRRRNGGAVPRAENFGGLITADHKVLSENCESRNNHRYAVVVQDLATQWIQSYPCKTKTSQETQKSLQKFLEPNRKPQVIYTDNSLEFGKACEDLSWNHCTSTPHRSETNGIAERAVRRLRKERLRYCCNEAWKNGGQIPWNAKPICGTFKITCLMGRHHMKDASENLSKDQLSRLVHWLSISL